jgi:hypothetical protein
MKRISIITLVAFSSLCSQAQFVKNNHVVYAEAGGAIFAGSVNYDIRFNPKSHFGWGARVGLGIVPLDKIYYIQPTGDYVSYWESGMPIIKIAVPVGVNYLFGKDKSPHTFEAGLNAVYIPKDASVTTWNITYKQAYQKSGQLSPSLFLGYRRQPLKSGFLWRAGYSPFIINGAYFQWASVAVGWKF